MAKRPISVQQMMILPTLLALGLGSLYYAETSAPQPVDAAPLPAEAAPVPKTSAAPTAASTASAEFGTPSELSEADRIKATTREQLVRMAREASGREDPFVALMNPDPSLVQPLPAPVLPLKTRVVSMHPARKVAFRVNTLGQKEVVIDPPEIGDEPARGPLVVPQWTLTGVLNTGRDQLALLELNGNTHESKLGEVLEDGSRVVKIESKRVVLMLNGRRFSKVMGGDESAH